ncbi:uncharacterized protein LOC143940591 [Lithobates pipiens]
MKGKPGLGVLLLLALVGAIVFWLSNTAADIFFLLADDSTTNHGSSAPVPQTRAFQSRTYNLSTSPETREIEGGLIEETTFIFTDIPTQSESEASSNTTPTVTDIYPATTETYTFSTEHLDKDWISLGPTTVQSPPDNTTGTVPGTNIVTHHTHLPTGSSFTEKGSFPENTTANMETNKSVCIRTSSLTDAEVLALVIGAVFLTIVLSALLYQFAVFMRKKQAHIDSSIYIIENEHNKQDFEANGSQPDTRL